MCKQQNVQGVPEKNAETLARDKFGTVCHEIKFFAPKCLAKITIWKSMQNLCKYIKYSLLNSRK